MNLLLAHLCIAAVTLTTGGLIPLLIWLLIMSLCVWAVFLVLGMLPLASEVKQIATVVVAIIFLLVLLQHLGLAV